MIALTNCRLVKYLTEGYKHELADILIDGKKIAAIYPCGENEFSGDTEIIDVKGRTVLPGFFDLHAHLMFSNQNWDYLIRRPEQIYLMESASFAKEYLRMGYTTIRDAGCNHYASGTVRDYIEKGVLSGARVITAGKILSPTAVGNECFGALYEEFDSPDKALELCRREKAHGVDFVKYMVTGAVLNLGGVPGEMVTTQEELDAVVKAAESLGLYVAAHCHGTEGIKAAIRAGVYTIEHASYMDRDSVDMIAEYGNRSVTIPTFAIPFILANELSGPQPEEFKLKANDASEAMAESMRMCLEAGVQIGFGSDLDMSSHLKYPGLEFTARANYNFSNEVILKQATIQSAQIAGLDDRLGTIKAGKYADLVVMDGKPDEDMSVMKKLPDMVFKEGRRFMYWTYRNEMV